MFRLATFIAAFLVATFLIQPAFAFTPDDEELAAQVRKVYGPLTSWEAEMTFPKYPDVSVHLWYARGKWRQEWKAGDTAKAVGVNDRVAGKCTVEPFPLSPMFVWMVPNPVEAWRSWGVDNATRVYGFCDEMPCMLLGAEPGDDTSPAVHLNNEDMAPLMVRYPVDQSMLTVRFMEYGTKSGFSVPKKVTVDMGGEVLECEVRWISVLRSDSQELYARDGLDATPCASPPAPFDILRDRFRYPQAQ